MSSAIRRSLSTGAVVSGIALIMLSISVDSVAQRRSPQIQTGPDAETTYDGLVRVNRSVMDVAWVKPDFDLTGYSKIMLVSGGIAYREVKDPGSLTRARSSSSEFPISESSRERLQQTVQDEFVEELEKLENWEIVTEPGADVLMVVGSLIDVVSRVPPTQPGRGGIYLSSVGEATLVLELRDSVSHEILARAADRRAAEPAFPTQSNTVTNWSEVRRLAKSWAQLLRRRLEELAKV
jgi:hypothetical protein